MTDRETGSGGKRFRKWGFWGMETGKRQIIFQITSIGNPETCISIDGPQFFLLTKSIGDHRFHAKHTRCQKHGVGWMTGLQTCPLATTQECRTKLSTRYYPRVSHKTVHSLLPKSVAQNCPLATTQECRTKLSTRY